MRFFLLSCLLVGAAFARVVQEEEFCDGSCHSRESLRQLVEDLRAELKETKSQLDDSNCTVCWSAPCLNGGTCVPLSTTAYRCDCPDNFGGRFCEKNITCTDKSCGPNAVCFVQNHQTNCACKLGYSGNPKYGCTAKIQRSCMSGDPHYQTFDGLHYDYQGTCAYVFSQPCTSLAAPYAPYAVRAKNILTANQWVSTVNEFEVDFYNTTVHVARFQNTRQYRVYVNQILVPIPYFSPNRENYKFRITTSGQRIVVENNQLVSVTFDGQSLCVSVPDVAEFQGNGTLCGLAGDIDKSCKDDLRWPNGTFSPTSGCQAQDNYVAAIYGDQWITNNFLQLDPTDICIDGQVVTNHTKNCDLSNAIAYCQTIQQAINGTGPFGACQGLGADFIQAAFDNCIFDTCRSPALKCSILELFVRECQAGLPGTLLPNWRNDPATQCQITCPSHSQYQSCASSCQASCATPDVGTECDGSCQESCVCDPGYVIDNTKFSSGLEDVVCIPIQQCGCNDPNGNPHPPSQPWLTDNCNTWNTCENGTYFNKPFACSVWGHCTIDNNQLACACDDGFTGNGTDCNDINECLDPTTCNADKGQGTCTNTNGSYICTCEGYYSGRNCENYAPQRHCADLYVYGKIRVDGTYNITPPYPYNGNPANTAVAVYCDMTTDGGGYTLLGNAVNASSTGKTLAQYTSGFGNSLNDDTFLGLELAHGMTNDQNTSLRLNLFRCAHNGQPERLSYCTYPSFTVRDASALYRVNIPEVCGGGTEQDFYDGWVRWDRSQDGPVFTATDSDNTTSHCSSTFQNTGFWFDTSYSRCGEANLNGVRYFCDNIPTDTDSYLFFGGAPLSQVTLYLRPFGYPNYDPHAPPPAL